MLVYYLQSVAKGLHVLFKQEMNSLFIEKLSLYYFSIGDDSYDSMCHLIYRRIYGM